MLLLPPVLQVKLADAASACRMVSPEVAWIFASGAPKEVIRRLGIDAASA